MRRKASTAFVIHVSGDRGGEGAKRTKEGGEPQKLSPPCQRHHEVLSKGGRGGLLLLYLGNPRVLASNLLALDQVLRPDPS